MQIKLISFSIDEHQDSLWDRDKQKLENSLLWHPGEKHSKSVVTLEKRHTGRFIKGDLAIAVCSAELTFILLT